MTVVYGGGNGRNYQNAGIDLSCLRAIESNGTGRNSTSGKDGGTAGKGEARFTALIVVAVLACFSILCLSAKTKSGDSCVIVEACTCQLIEKSCRLEGK